MVIFYKNHCSLIKGRPSAPASWRQATAYVKRGIGATDFLAALEIVLFTKGDLI